MADVFLSYASEDRPRAQRVAAALQSLGWSVWWDRKIPAGRSFAEVIEEAISSSRCVIVLWSKESVGSKWVREEADEGEKGHKLIPVMLDDAKPPMGFRSIQAADLIGWEGSISTPGFRQLIADLAPLIGPPPNVREAPVPQSTLGPVKPDVSPRRPSEPGSGSRRWVVAVAIGSIVVALAGWGAYAYWRAQQTKVPGLRLVQILYPDETARSQAEGLAKHFRTLGWQVSVKSGTAGQAARVEYLVERDASIALIVARSAEQWLAQQGQPKPNLTTAFRTPEPGTLGAQGGYVTVLMPPP